MPARRWPSSSTSSCRTSSSPRRPGTPTWCCRPRRTPRSGAPSPTPTGRCRSARPVVDPPGEARQDWKLIQELAQRVGLNWTYKDVSEVFAEMAQVMPSLDNITWERLRARGRRHLSVRCARQARQRDHLRDLVPDQVGPRQDRAGRPRAARRAARRELSDGADHRPPAGALAHRLHDAARVQPRCSRARGDRRPEPARDGQARHRARRRSSRVSTRRGDGDR